MPGVMPSPQDDGGKDDGRMYSADLAAQLLYASIIQDPLQKIKGGYINCSFSWLY